MKEYTKPEVKFTEFGTQDILTSSAEFGIRLPEIEFKEVINHVDLNADMENTIQTQDVE